MKTEAPLVTQIPPQPQHRILGFRHRVKVRIVDGEPTEPLPSHVVILFPDGNIQEHDLTSEQDELDFVNGILPVKFRSLTEPSEDISAHKPWQVKWRASTEEDLLVSRHDSQCKWHNKRVKKGQPPERELVEVATEVPTHFVGLQANDCLATCLGGSGDYFAFATAVKLHSMGGEVYRLPAFKLQQYRGVASKDDDAHLLAKLLASNRGDFYPTVVRDLSIISVRETFKLRMDAMKDRMACAQRLRQRLIGMTFCTTDGGFPQGGLEKRYDALKASDPIYLAIEESEAKALKAMTEAVEATDVYQKLFADIPGVGPAISARLISCIIDVRRFETDAKLKKFLGVHVMPDGTFVRRRNGQVANWHPDGRQALYLLADQFVKKPGSEWGMKLNAYKAKLRLKHPYICIAVATGEMDEKTGKTKVELVPLVPGKHKVDKKAKKYVILDDEDKPVRTVSGTMRYNDGHIHKMAIWRTLSKFAEWLHREWWKIEEAHKASKIAPAVPSSTPASASESSEI